MQGTSQVRHCTHCDRKVYNLSEMTRHEALTLLLRTEGRICARYYVRSDGSVMTRDCGRVVKRRKRIWSLAAAALSALGIGVLRPDLVPALSNTAAQGEVTQGSVAVAVTVAPTTMTVAPTPIMGKLANRAAMQRESSHHP